MADRNDRTKIETDDAGELKRYLFYESSEAERARLEARFFDDDALFYELLDLENDLTDRYARGELGETDRRRFKASLKKSSARRDKLANAQALQSFIKAETKSAAPPVFERQNTDWRSRMSNFFGLNQLSWQSAAVIFLLLVGIGLLIYGRQRDAAELAQRRENENRQTLEAEQAEAALREQIELSRERVRALQNALAEQRGQTDVLTEQLTREQTEKARLESALGNFRREKKSNAQPSAPTIAAVILAPIGGKSGGAANVVSVGRETATIFATLQIPKESTAETFDVQLNSAPLAENLKPNRTESGNKFIRVRFPLKSLIFDTENLLSVTGNDGSRYNYALRRRQ